MLVGAELNAELAKRTKEGPVQQKEKRGSTRPHGTKCLTYLYKYSGPHETVRAIRLERREAPRYGQGQTAAKRPQLFCTPAERCK